MAATCRPLTMPPFFGKQITSSTSVDVSALHTVKGVSFAPQYAIVISGTGELYLNYPDTTALSQITVNADLAGKRIPGGFLSTDATTTGAIVLHLVY